RRQRVRVDVPTVGLVRVVEADLADPVDARVGDVGDREGAALELAQLAAPVAAAVAHEDVDPEREVDGVVLRTLRPLDEREERLAVEEQRAAVRRCARAWSDGEARQAGGGLGAPPEGIARGARELRGRRGRE